MKVERAGGEPLLYAFWPPYGYRMKYEYMLPGCGRHSSVNAVCHSESWEICTLG